MRGRPIVAGMLATLLAVTGCSGTSADEAGAAEAEGYSVLGALAEVPASALDEGEPLIMTADVATATEVARLARPSDTEDMEALSDWMSVLAGYPLDGKRLRTVFVPMGPMLQRPFVTLSFDAFEEQFGWSVVDVDTFVETALSKESYLMVSGDIDAEAEYAGSDHVAVALTDGKAVMASSQEHVDAWLDGGSDTLADDEALAALASALDDGDVLAATLFPGTEPDGGGDGSTSEAWSRAGIGWGEDAILLAYHYPSADAAQRAVQDFEELFRSDDPAGADARRFLRLRETSVDGPVVVLTVRPTADGAAISPYELYMRRQAPFTDN